MKIYRSYGQHTKHGLFGVTGIDFCCDKMADDVLFGKVTTRPWTDHPLNFYVKDKTNNGYHLSHCGHCGAKIEGEIYRDSDKP